MRSECLQEVSHNVICDTVHPISACEKVEFNRMHNGSTSALMESKKSNNADALW